MQLFLKLNAKGRRNFKVGGDDATYIHYTVNVLFLYSLTER